LNTHALDGYDPIAMSPAASELLSRIVAEPSYARIGVTLLVSEEDGPEMLQLATDVQRVAGELAEVGSLPIVIDLLRDAWLQKALRERRKAA
jgi:hypothetical protein